MSEVTKKYLTVLQDKLNEIIDTQIENIDAAAKLVVESCENGGRFYVFGSGHSHMVAEEIYIRAGGLGYVKAILPPELMLHEMPNKSTWLERLDGYSKAILDLYKVDNKDTIMIISNSGRNNVPVEMAIEAKNKGAKVIALTSLKHSKEVTSRHKSGLRLFECADVVIDNVADKGDANFYVDNFNVPTGPTSDFAGIALANSLIVTVIDQLVKDGIQPPVFRSSNVDGADEYNNELFDKYYGYWK
ncbi:MAG: SIS domain-containing protein [Traorella sp.]